MKMNTKMNGWVLANAIFCFSCVFSTTTDYSSGAAYEYAPNSYFVTLVPEGTIETPSDIKKRKTKSFIMGNYSSIIKALSKTSDRSRVSKSSRTPKRSSSNQYLTTLFTLLEIPEADRESARDKIKTISSETKDPLLFADNIANSFIQ